MNPTTFWLILRARYRIVLLVLTLSFVTALATSLLLPKTYRASTLLVLNYKGIDPVTGQTLPAQLMPGYMATQVDILHSARVALQVVDDLSLAKQPDVQRRFDSAANGKGDIRDWLAETLAKKLEVVPARESSVLEIGFRDHDPAFAATIANAFAAAYQQVSISLTVEPSRKAAGYFNNQTRLLRENLEKAQNRLSSYQQSKGIVSADNRLDIESARLNELSSQLVAVQAQASEASSRLRQTVGLAGASPDVLASPLIQTLKASLGVAEAKFAEVAQRLEKNHPQYRAAKSEVDQLRANLNEQVRQAGVGVAGNARILQQRESDIRAALAAQTARVMQLNGARDELKVLTNEMESAQKAYENAAQRYTQTRMEGQSNQSDIAILNPAVPPISAASPRLVPNLMVSVVLGVVFGLGLALLAELADRRVRSAADLTQVPGLPLLGEVAWGAPARRAAWRWSPSQAQRPGTRSAP